MHTRNRKDRKNAAHEPCDCADDPYDQTIQKEQDTGLREAFLDHSCGMADLAAPLRHRLAVNQFDHNGDVPRLDDVEYIFTHPIHNRAKNAETGKAAPHRRARAKTLIPEAADAPSDPGTYARDEDVA